MFESAAVWSLAEAAMRLTERRIVPGAWRTALMAALIPAPTATLPALDQTDVADFWPRFEQSAPLHVRLALVGATLALGGLLPLVTQGRTLAALDADARQRLIDEAAHLPVARDLLEVAKVVACLA